MKRMEYSISLSISTRCNVTNFNPLIYNLYQSSSVYIGIVDNGEKCEQKELEEKADMKEVFEREDVYDCHASLLPPMLSDYLLTFYLLF